MAKGEVLGLVLAEGVEITEGVEILPGSIHAEVVDASGWDGTETEISYDVSSQVPDARKLAWTFSRNGDDHLQLGYEIRKTETHVTVTTSIPPAAGTYTLIGVG